LPVCPVFAERPAAERILPVKTSRGLRLETSFSRENLVPARVYGSWNAANFWFYFPAPGKGTAFAQASMFTRKEGKGVLTAVGAYKDWGTAFYTYTSLAAGSNAGFLPKFRADNDLNFKVLRDKSLVLTGGASYIAYHDVHRDLLLSAGATLYRNPLIISYRAFHNKSDPGAVGSWTHVESAGYGYEGRHWTFFTWSTGKQAYLATALNDPQEVRQNAAGWTLTHRRWLTKGFGLTGEASRSEIKDGYTRNGFALGCFQIF